MCYTGGMDITSDIEIIPLTADMCEEIFGGHDYMVWGDNPETATEVCSLCGKERE